MDISLRQVDLTRLEHALTTVLSPLVHERCDDWRIAVESSVAELLDGDHVVLPIGSRARDTRDQGLRCQGSTGWKLATFGLVGRQHFDVRAADIDSQDLHGPFPRIKSSQGASKRVCRTQPGISIGARGKSSRYPKCDGALNR